jgi:hypothetical protein
MLAFPKDNAQFSWTRHIKNKMVFYHLSGAQLLRIFRKPNRREEGIAPDTVGAMQTKKATGAKAVRSEEIWIMYKINSQRKTHNKQLKTSGNFPLSAADRKLSVNKSRVTFISAWRYPGITKKGERPLIPEDIAKELEMEL